jgi:hypothetical protein
VNRSTRSLALVLPRLALAAVVAAGLAAAPASADEGMWTYDNPPLQLLKERYGFTPDAAWLDHMRLSSVRFMDGGSGSFVSADGLVLTNHHVAMGQLQKLSTAEHDYARDGFLAKTRVDELSCPDLELNVLESLQDVTARVQAAGASAADPGKALAARRAETALIEKEVKDSSGKDCQVVTLYQGGEYWLYTYRKFTDVRVAFAPEFQAAFFGGDPDNFTYPRYCLDMTLFRVYDDGQPYRPAHFLKWNPKGAEEGELVFVSGHPGSTERLDTLAELETARDVGLPMQLATFERRHAALTRYGSRGDEQQRQANDQIFGIENALKALGGQHKGLLDPALMGKKAAEEQDFRARVAGNPEWSKAYGSAWDEIAAASAALRSRAKETTFWSVGRSASRMATNAVRIVQYVAEIAKPDGERLPGYHDAELESTRFTLFSKAPVYPELETALLADWFAYQQEQLPAGDRFLAACLDGKAPAEAARALIEGSQMHDPAFRKSLVEGGAAAVQHSQDPLIALARRVDPLLRELRDWREEAVESRTTAAGERIGAARFAVYGKTVSPDATFTLRLSYGAVKGYDFNGTVAPPKTTFHGLFDRSLSFGGKSPFDLAPRWKDAAKEIELSTPFDFVCTTDIIGGNSGSPVANRAGELVGLVFDGNIESLVGNYVYDEASNRTVAVHAAGMTEAMAKVYGAEALVAELLGQSRQDG